MNITQELEKFGLSTKQIKIYMVLLRHGELRIQEIVNHTQFPRSSVYENLKDLFRLGLIEEVIEDSFKKIRAYPIGSLRFNLKERISHFEELLDILSNLEKIPELNPEATLTVPTKVRYYKDVSGARQLLWNSLRAENTVCIYSAWGRSDYVGRKFYESFVSESHDRKIQEKVLVNPSAKVIEAIKGGQDSSTSRTSMDDIRLLQKNVLIKGETFIYNDIYSQVYLSGKDIYGFEIESQDFTQTQRSIFEALWSTSSPYLNV